VDPEEWPRCRRDFVVDYVSELFDEIDVDSDHQRQRKIEIRFDLAPGFRLLELDAAG
jgi:hypothetical protein